MHLFHTGLPQSKNSKSGHSGCSTCTRNEESGKSLNAYCALTIISCPVSLLLEGHDYMCEKCLSLPSTSDRNVCPHLREAAVDSEINSLAIHDGNHSTTECNESHCSTGNSTLLTNDPILRDATYHSPVSSNTVYPEVTVAADSPLFNIGCLNACGLKNKDLIIQSLKMLLKSMTCFMSLKQRQTSMAFLCT